MPSFNNLNTVWCVFCAFKQSTLNAFYLKIIILLTFLKISGSLSWEQSQELAVNSLKMGGYYIHYPFLFHKLLVRFLLEFGLLDNLVMLFSNLK